ncbi:hypothetical protein AB0H97_06335 [Streptomyces sp. NPDC050788]|jgi:hypothetical protein|uniref:hypothetical protein n=1 Tax=Streptomyces sp. NPDC050788 TaxID=3155041 RepID=UPI00341ECFA6
MTTQQPLTYDAFIALATAPPNSTSSSSRRRDHRVLADKARLGADEAFQLATEQLDSLYRAVKLFDLLRQ